MSYDIGLYNKAFLARVLAENIDDWTTADPFPPGAIDVARRILAAKGYTLECDDEESQEYLHPAEELAIQVGVFPNEITFSVPYSDDAEEAIAVALADAHEIAQAADLGIHDPQIGDSEE